MDDITGMVDHDSMNDAVTSSSRQAGGRGRGVRALGTGRVEVDNQGVASITVSTRDPDVVSALSELLASDAGEAAAIDYIQTAMRVGVIALRQARPTVDERSLRNAGEQLVSELKVAVEAQSKSISQLLEAQVEKGLKQSLAEYLDPKSGKFATRADAMAAMQDKLQKELPANIAEQVRMAAEQQLSGDNSRLAAVIAKQVGEGSEFFKKFDPKQRDGVIATIESRVKDLLDEQRKTVLAEFSMDNENSAIKRLLSGVDQISHGLKQEFSLDNAAGALKRLNDQLSTALKATQDQINAHLDMNLETSALKRIKVELDAQLASLAKSQREAADREAEEARKFQSEVRQVLSEFTARKEERNKSTGGGLDFEQEVFRRIQALASTGELVEFVGNETGIIPHCKKGDVLLIMDEESEANINETCGRIVFEAKQDSTYTPRKACNEVIEAVENRSAHVGVFVMSPESAKSANWHRRFERQGNNILLQWHPDVPETDAFLEAAVSLARAMVVHLAQPESEAPEVDWEAIDKALAELEKQCERFEGIRGKCDSIKSAASFIDDEARKMADKIEKSLGRLTEQLDAIRTGSGDQSE